MPTEKQVTPSKNFDPVTIDNLPSVEFINQAERLLKMSGGLNKFYKFRFPTPIDNQPVIRMNRDTLYMVGVFDISKGLSVEVPDMDQRYISVMPVNEQGYTPVVYTGMGTHYFGPESVGSNYAAIIIRILVNAADPADVKEVNQLQDEIKVTANSAIPFKTATYNQDDYQRLYAEMINKGRSFTSFKKSFGSKQDVDYDKFRIASIIGWGGLPDNQAFYVNVEPKLPVGEYKIDVQDVPVKAFWSVSLYNDKGYFQPNELDMYSVNSITATENANSSYTIHFGGCEDHRINCLPIMDGWNYVIRLYEPEANILNGSWTFPEVVELK